MKEESQTSHPEQASWLGDAPPWNWESIKKLVTVRITTLFDGAYFGFTGEPILMKRCDKEGRIIQIVERYPTQGKIIACNPGAKKVSRFFSLYPEWHSLAIRSWEGYERINHVEADNGKLIREVGYGEIFRYLGDKDWVIMLSLMRAVSLTTAQVFGPHAKFFDVPETAYQVTKEWVKSGLFLTDNVYDPSENDSFSGGWWTFRRRRRATV